MSQSQEGLVPEAPKPFYVAPWFTHGLATIAGAASFAFGYWLRHKVTAHMEAGEAAAAHAPQHSAGRSENGQPNA